MNLTNKLNLPSSFVQYAKNHEHEYSDKTFSVTELLLPVREIILQRKFHDKLTQDVSDYIPALFGTAVHSVLEENTPEDKNLVSETNLSVSFGEYSISGRIDLLNFEELSIEDYKTCSVSKVAKEDFEDWRLQGLMYAYLVWRDKHIILKKLKFYAIMKDWSKIKSQTSSNYPSSAVYVWEYQLQDSDYDFIEKWIERKLDDVVNAILKNEVPDCTEEEKWYSGTVYAVYKKKDDKRAATLCNTEEEARGYILNKLNGIGEIQVRYGEDVKCKYYCPCSKFCLKGEKKNEVL